LLSAIVNDVERFGLSHDALGHVSSATDPEERGNSFERNLRGDVQRIVDTPSGAQRLFASDVFGNVTSYTDPLGGLRQLDFGDDNLLDSATDALGNVTQFARDTENRVSSIDYADGLNVSVQYAGSGLPGRIQGNDGTDVTITSTPEGQVTGGTGLTIDRTLTGKVGNNNGIGIEYNSDDRVRRVTFAPGRYVDYEYDGRGNVVRVTDWLGAVTTITPTDVGKIDTVNYPNGIATDYDYDRAERITRIGMGSLGAITVNRDVLGRIASVDRTLPSATGMPNEDRNFTYNLASQVDGGTYDARGNQLQQGQNSRTWDALNRLTSINNAADQVVVGYDAVGGVTRIAASTGERLYAQNYALKSPRISIERDGAGNDLWYYVHTFDGRLLYRISPTGTRQFYHFDENGNTVLLTNDSGAVIQSYFIAPHGEVLDQSGNIENPKVVSAEQGGINLGDSGTILTGSSYIDSDSGHLLSLGLEVRFDMGTSAQASFGSEYGRSIAPGKPVKPVREAAAVSGFFDITTPFEDEFIDVEPVRIEPDRDRPAAVDLPINDVERAFFAWGASEGPTVLGGLFNNPIGLEESTQLTYADLERAYKATSGGKRRATVRKAPPPKRSSATSWSGQSGDSSRTQPGSSSSQQNSTTVDSLLKEVGGGSYAGA